MRVLIAWLPVTAYVALIWIVSSGPHGFDLSVVPFRDKGVHFVEYLVLGVLTALAVRRSWPSLGGARFYLAASLPAVALGYLDELHQAFVPGRFASGLDALADILGVLTGVAFFMLLALVRDRHRA